MKRWITRAEAIGRLGVKPQTLYAYVSRGRVRARPDPRDGRCSLFNAADISDLIARRTRGRSSAAIAASSMAWGEPSIETQLSTVVRGSLYYRGQDAVALARTSSLEDVAALLWNSPGPASFGRASPRMVDAVEALAALVPTAAPLAERSQDELFGDAAVVVTNIATSCGAAPRPGPLHRRLAEGWGRRPEEAEVMRQALVIMADHDLNASTFACRVVASTGASLAASVLAALCAFYGPRHGKAAEGLRKVLEEARLNGIDETLDRTLDQGNDVPGFGHPLYPEGDPRCRLLLEGIELDAFQTEFVRGVRRRSGAIPNSDFALHALSEHHGWPPGAPLCLFLVGRSVGWCAHALEQAQTPGLIRPRGAYKGVSPIAG